LNTWAVSGGCSELAVLERDANFYHPGEKSWGFLNGRRGVPLWAEKDDPVLSFLRG